MPLNPQIIADACGLCDSACKNLESLYGDNNSTEIEIARVKIQLANAQNFAALTRLLIAFAAEAGKELDHP